MFDALKDGLAVALFGLGFAACAIHDAAIYLWKNAVPDDQPTKGDEQFAASVEQFPLNYITFVVALIGVIGCGAIVAWGL